MNLITLTEKEVIELALDQARYELQRYDYELIREANPYPFIKKLYKKHYHAWNEKCIELSNYWFPGLKIMTIKEVIYLALHRALDITQDWDIKLGETSHDDGGYARACYDIWQARWIELDHYYDHLID